MASIVPAPIALNDITIKVDADNYEAGVNEVTLTPTANTQVFRGMTPDAIFPVAGGISWMLTIGHAQDHATAKSLTLYMQANAGQKKTFEFAPKKGGPSYKIDALCLPGQIGGQADATAVAQLQLPCFGQPVRTPAV